MDKIRAIERAIGLPQMNPSQGETVEFRGGFYSTAQMIAIPAKPGEDMRWDFLHELGHAVYAEFLLGYLISINEGIAEYAAERMIAEDPNAAALLQERRDWLLEQCRQAVAEGLPSIEAFVPLGHWQFLDESVRDRNYALAWSLVRFLNRSEDSAVVGLFGDFMSRMARSTQPWRSFQETWDIVRLEPLWHDYVEAIAHWTSVYGRWVHRGRDVSVDVSPTASAWTLWRQKPNPGETYSISFVVAADLVPEVGFGFVLGHTDWENLVVVELHPSKLLTITRREAGLWGEALDFPLGLDRHEFAGERLRLDCDQRGRISLSLAGETLMSHDLGSMVHAGWLGLFAEHLERGEAAPARAVFHDPKVRIDG